LKERGSESKRKRVTMMNRDAERQEGERKYEEEERIRDEERARET